jgi:hypothetical protein
MTSIKHIWLSVAVSRRRVAAGTCFLCTVASLAAFWHYDLLQPPLALAFSQLSLPQCTEYIPILLSYVLQTIVLHSILWDVLFRQLIISHLVVIVILWLNKLIVLLYCFTFCPLFRVYDNCVFLPLCKCTWNVN